LSKHYFTLKIKRGFTQVHHFQEYTMKNSCFTHADLSEHDITTICKNKNFTLFTGIALFILGIFSLIASVFTTFVTLFLLGALFIASGIVTGISSFWLRTWTGFFSHALIGIFSFILGAIILLNPTAGAVAFTLLLGAFFTVTGLFRLITALAVPLIHPWLLFFNGLITTMLGVLVLRQWPLSSLWIIGMFIGIDLLMQGWYLIFIGALAHKLCNNQ
jgi:uncharacterized membrane protein HdeD (DUF308 family)